MAATLVACETLSSHDGHDDTHELCEKAKLFRVRIPLDGYESIPRIADLARKWLNSDAAEGYYMVTNLIDRMYQPTYMMVYFTDGPTAFAFKMRFA